MSESLNINFGGKSRVIYIYTLSHPISEEVRYVGKTCNLKERYQQHCNRSKRTYTWNWIKGLKSQGLLPKMEVLEETNEKEWKESERFWIETLKFYGLRLTNHVAGGYGWDSLSPESRARMSNAHRGMKRSQEACLNIRMGRLRYYREGGVSWHKGKTLPPMSMEARMKIGLANLGKKRSEETKRKMSLSRQGRKESQEFKDKIKASWIVRKKKKYAANTQIS